MNELVNVEYLVIHHTGRELDFPALINLRHRILRGWEDIGYHHIIGNGKLFTKDGAIYSGRSEKYQGAHTLGFNDKSIGIAIMGDFDLRFPSTRQISSLVKLIREKMAEYTIPTSNVIGHNEVKGVTKTCPGKKLNLEELRAILSR